MKKVTIFALFFLFVIIEAEAQYKTFTFGNIKYESNCQKLSNGTICLSIILNAVNPHVPNPHMLMLTKEQRIKFVTNLKLIRNKFVEYDSVCQKNSVENISRIINHEDDISEQPLILFDDKGKYYNASPLYFAYVRKEGHGTMCLHSGRLVDMKDENIQSDGGLIMFFSADEIDEMIQSFEEEAIEKYVNLLD